MSLIRCLLLTILRVVYMCDEWNIQTKVNPTQVRDVMPHPVLISQN